MNSWAYSVSLQNHKLDIFETNTVIVFSYFVIITFFVVIMTFYVIILTHVTVSAFYVIIMTSIFRPLSKF